MVSNNFTVDADWIGNWDGEEEQAAKVWNMWIAPALLALEERGTIMTDKQFDRY